MKTRGRREQETATASVGVGVAVVVAVAVANGCVSPPRMCTAESECGGRSACVAGRCVAQGATAAIDSGRRLLFSPVDEAYIPRAGGPAGDAPVVTLGRARDGAALALLRFAIRLPPEATLLEAYLLLERAPDVDMDPQPISLHAARIVDRWDGASTTWARSPRIEDTGAPVTRVSPSSGSLIRVEVREIVQRWRRRGHGDFGLAVVAEGESATGVSFAWQPSQTAFDRRDVILEQPSAVALEPPSPFEPGPPAPALMQQVGEPRAQLVGPRLEVYVR
jgi:hypothetical protein